MNRYHFYGHEADIRDGRGLSVRDYYDLLSEIWCAETCAPRMRERWTRENRTLGQCSITAFLMQDLFGGKVYGILRGDGNYHCFNVVDGCVFDLTSEQFGDEVLDYTDCPEQFREVHFAKAEKKTRYEYLKTRLLRRLPTTLDTARLVLRPWRESDAEELYKYARDPDVGPITGWPVHTSVENSREIIRAVLSAPQTFALVLKQTGLPVGNIGIMFPPSGNLPLAENECEFGFWLGKPYWGQGLMPEAVREALRYVFEELGVETVRCGCYDGNDKSRRVQEKCGFTYERTQIVDVRLMGEKRVCHISFLTKRKWEQIERITRYERMMRKAEQLLQVPDDETRDALRQKIDALGSYYGSDTWKQDFADDEAGLLPHDLPRGVLSEDGIYDLLEAYRERSQEA